MRKLCRSLVTLFLVQFVLSSAEAQTLRIGVFEDPDILDPQLTRSFSAQLALVPVCDRLFVVTPEKQIVPQLATDYSWSEDHRTLTLELRHGVLFHDGEPFNAAAVKYTIERGLTLPGSTAKTGLGPISNVEAVNDHRVTIDFFTPYPPIMAILAGRQGMIISPKSAKGSTAFDKRPICAGPFKFVERVAQDRVVLERFENYWDKDNIFIDRVIFRPVPDTTVRFTNLRSGDLDLIERMAAVDYVEIGKYPKLRGVTVTGFADFYMPIFFNINHGSRARTPLGQDPRVREAFELAIDRNVINDIVYMGQHIPSNQWLAPDDPYYATSLPIPKRDVIKARDLLAAAGATNLTVELMMVNSPEYRQVGELLQAMTGEAGFDLRLRPTEVGAMFQALRKGDFEAVMYANVGRGDPDTAVYPWLGCDGFLNDGQYCAPGVEKSLLEARTRFAPDERKRFYDDATAGILHDRPAIYLFIRRFLYGHTARLSGFRPIPGGYIHLQGLKLN